MTTESSASLDSSIRDAPGAAGSGAAAELKTSAVELKSESKAGLAHTQPRAREVEYSCRLVAALRAQESLRKDALFRDPFAAALAGGDHLMDHGHFIVRQDQERSEASRKRAAEQIAAMQAERAERPEIVIRTHFIDCLLRDCVRERERWQVVLLGAGLDSRAYRLECLARCAVFEVDQASVIAYKRAKLAEIAEAKLLAASLAHVPGDLSRPVSAAVVAPMLSKDRRYVAEERKQRISTAAETALSEHSATPAESKSEAVSGPADDWAAGLLAAGFSRKDPTIWIAEGVLMYLNERQARTLLRTVAALSGSGSRLCGDLVNSATVQSRLFYYRLFQFGCDRARVAGFLRPCGWRVTSLAPIAKDGISYGRYLRDPIVLQPPERKQQKQPRTGGAGAKKPAKQQGLGRAARRQKKSQLRAEAVAAAAAAGNGSSSLAAARTECKSSAGADAAASSSPAAAAAAEGGESKQAAAEATPAPRVLETMMVVAILD